MSSTCDAQPKPGLLFFFDSTDGHARRVEGFLAGVLQRRRNHDTFKIYRIDVRQRPDLAERFRIEQTPALCVTDGGRIAGRVNRPSGMTEIEQLLRPWLRAPGDPLVARRPA